MQRAQCWGHTRCCTSHANEQPFTRTQPGLVIPAGVTEIIVEGRDQANGYGGLAMTVAVPEP